jgi:hypothetical protein
MVLTTFAKADVAHDDNNNNNVNVEENGSSNNITFLSQK